MKIKLTGGVMALTVILTACGGSGNGATDSSEAAASQPATLQYDASTLGPECLVLPGPGQKLQFSAYMNGVPASFYTADFKGIGPVAFEGASYQGIEINAVSGFFYTANDVKQTALFKPEAPLMPLAAISHMDPGTTADDKRYRYTYQDPVSLKTVQPDITGLPLNTPRQYIVYEERGVGGGPLSAPQKGTGITVTYTGREDVDVRGVKYRQACKVDLSSVSATRQYRGTVWLAPQHGIVKFEGRSLSKPVSGYLETTGLMAAQ